MLEAVEYQKHLLALQMLLKVSCSCSPATSLIPSVSARTDRQGSISQWSKGHEDDPVFERLMRALGHFEGQAGLAHPAGPVRVNRRVFSRRRREATAATSRSRR